VLFTTRFFMFVSGDNEINYSVSYEVSILVRHSLLAEISKAVQL
jgi:hypothetical protein